ncbi:MAG: Rrf2 family transcriptional regulator [Dechloromonas sp.]|nr:Rrf2 family transcriptional regulator [Dechloromonas sp.]
MHLTTFTDYTLRVLIYLALEPERLATIPEMASAYGISENHLMKVVHRLARSGTIESVRGKGGGVRLARPPTDIRLGEVIRASEGDSAIVKCLSDTANSCRIAPVCRLSKILNDAFTGLYRSLDAFTLADLCANGGEIRGRLSASDDGPAIHRRAR